MKMKTAKIMVFTIIMMALLALPDVLAGPKEEKPKVGIAIADYCYFEKADFAGNMGIMPLLSQFMNT